MDQKDEGLLFQFNILTGDSIPNKGQTVICCEELLALIITVILSPGYTIGENPDHNGCLENPEGHSRI